MKTKIIKFIVLLIHSNLQRIGINNTWNYISGNWYGNSSKSGYETFLDVTHNISDLIEGFEVRYESSFCTLCYKTREITSNSYFGRCFEIEIEKKNKTISSIWIDIKKTVYMYINLPHIFLNAKQKSKIQVNTGENLEVEASYEILQTHFNDNCRKYSKTYGQSYDACKFEVMAKNLNNALNCSVPFTYKQNRTKDICQNEAVAKRAFWDIYARDLFVSQPECPVPCVNMITSFGYPIVKKRADNKGGVDISFNGLVKVTEDFISYDLLRFISVFNNAYILLV